MAEEKTIAMEIVDVDPDLKEERIKAIATIVVTAVVNIINLWGYSVDLDMAVNAVLTILSAITWIWCWWKNHNLTKEAATSQLLLDALKANKKMEQAAEKD